MKNYINYVSNNYLPVNIYLLCSLYAWRISLSLHNKASLKFWNMPTLSVIYFIFLY